MLKSGIVAVARVDCRTKNITIAVIIRDLVGCACDARSRSAAAGLPAGAGSLRAGAWSRLAMPSRSPARRAVWRS